MAYTNLIIMFLRVPLERLLGPKRSNASRMWTDQLVHSSVDHHEVVDHLLVVSAIDATVGADRLASERLQMPEKMQPIFVVVRSGEVLAANGARCCGVIPQSGGVFYLYDI